MVELVSAVLEISLNEISFVAEGSVLVTKSFPGGCAASTSGIRKPTATTEINKTNNKKYFENFLLFNLVLLLANYFIPLFLLVHLQYT